MVGGDAVRLQKVVALTRTRRLPESILELLTNLPNRVEGLMEK